MTSDTRICLLVPLDKASSEAERIQQLRKTLINMDGVEDVRTFITAPSSDTKGGLVSLLIELTTSSFKKVGEKVITLLLEQPTSTELSVEMKGDEFKLEIKGRSRKDIALLFDQVIDRLGY